MRALCDDVPRRMHSKRRGEGRAERCQRSYTRDRRSFQAPRTALRASATPSRNDRTAELCVWYGESATAPLPRTFKRLLASTWGSIVCRPSIPHFGQDKKQGHNKRPLISRSVQHHRRCNKIVFPRHARRHDKVVSRALLCRLWPNCAEARQSCRRESVGSARLCETPCFQAQSSRLDGRCRDAW